jgi:hypothetical protein
MSRAAELSRLPIVFGLGVDDAAASIGIGVTKFRQLVHERRMPPARRIDGRYIWDVDELRAAFKSLPHDDDRAGREYQWEDMA